MHPTESLAQEAGMSTEAFADLYYDAVLIDWAENAAQSVSQGAEVRTGKTEGSDWEVQSVLIKKNVGEDKAKQQAKEIYDKIGD